MNSEHDLSAIAKELIYKRRLVDADMLRKRLSELKVAEYLALNAVFEADREGVFGGRTYLKDLADELGFSMRKTSKTVAALRDKGLLLWEHDGDGTDGTYVLITEDGEEMIRRQNERFNEYCDRVVERFGKEDMIKLLHMLKELETCMSAELEETEDATDDE